MPKSTCGVKKRGFRAIGCFISANRAIIRTRRLRGRAIGLSPLFPALSLALLAILAAAAAACLWLGLFPRRRGQTPYCRKCGYNLTGAVALRCTECGADLLAKRAVVRGERRRRRWLIALGCLLGVGFLGLGTVTGIRAARSIDLYQYAPLWWVIGDLQGGPPAVQSQAIRELDRRWNADQLTKEDCAAFIEFLLAEQQNWPPTPGVSDRAMNLLGVIILANNATEAQVERFLVNFVRLELLTRKHLRAGRLIPYRVNAACAGPHIGFEAVITRSAVRVDGERSRTGSTGRSILSGSARSSGGGTLDTDLEPGRHELTCDVKVEIYTTGVGGIGGVDASRPGKPLRVYEQTLHATFDVVDATWVAKDATVSGPEIDDQIRQAVSIDCVKFERHASGQRGQLYVQMTALAGLPIPLAGELIGEFDDGRSQRLGLVCFAANSRKRSETVGETCWSRDPQRVTVRFVPSADAAEETVDIVQYWGGTIDFGSFDLVPSPDE